VLCLFLVMAQLPPDGGVVLRVFQGPAQEPQLLVASADGYWRDRHGRLRDPPTAAHELSDPSAAPVFAHDEWVKPPRAEVRRASPVANLSWGMSPDELGSVVKTSFHRQRWPLELGGVRFFASPSFVDVGRPALTALELESTSAPALVWPALQRLFGTPTFTGSSWRAWQTADSSVHAVEDRGRVRVLVVSRLFLLFDRESDLRQ